MRRNGRGWLGAAPERLKSDQVRSKRRQERLKTDQDRAKSGQERPKSDQEQTKSGQERPKSDPERPKSARNAILEASWLVLGRVWEAKPRVFLRFLNTFCETMFLR